MSTPCQISDSVEVIPDGEDETVTFVADLDRGETVPPTEWITVAKKDVVDVNENR